jgi:hypothetical protein
VKPVAPAGITGDQLDAVLAKVATAEGVACEVLVTGSVYGMPSSVRVRFPVVVAPVWKVREYI